MVLALLVAAGLASCGDDQPTGPGNFPDVRGPWNGQYSVTNCEALTGIDPFFCTDVFYEGRSLTLDMVLNQTNERVSGNAIQGSVAGQVSGTVNDAGLVSLSGQLGVSESATTTIENWATLLVGDSLDGSWQFLVEDNLDEGFGSARVNADMVLLGPDVLAFFGCPVQSWVSQTDSINGVLDNGDCMLDDESFFDVYAVDVVVGDSIEFRMSSTEFDPFIFITQADENPLAAAGGLGQPVASTGTLARSNETWLIVANTFLDAESGAYSLVTTKIGGSMTSSPVNLRRVGVTDRSALRDLSKSDPSMLESVREYLSAKFADPSTPAAALKRKGVE